MMIKRVSLLSFGIAFALMLGSAVTHAKTVRKSVELNVETRVGNETVQKGMYLLSVDDRKEGEFTLRNGKQSYTVSFKRQPLEMKAREDRIYYQDLADGSRRIEMIQLRGQDFALVLQ